MPLPSTYLIKMKVGITRYHLIQFQNVFMQIMTSFLCQLIGFIERNFAFDSVDFPDTVIHTLYIGHVLHFYPRDDHDLITFPLQLCYFNYETCL